MSEYNFAQYTDSHSAQSPSSSSAFEADNVVKVAVTPGTNEPASETLWLCPICLGFPRFPASITKCGHIGCESCLRTLLTLRTKDLPIGTALCPVCRVRFVDRELLTFDRWPLLMKQTWRTFHIRCGDDGCDFVSNPYEMIDHKVHDCPKRKVVCPAFGCHEQLPPTEMLEHMKSCDSLCVYCVKCAYPIRHTKRAAHNCMRLMRRYIDSM